MAKQEAKLHVGMFPWFAFGHFIPFMHLSNELAMRGHRVSFLLPRNALHQLQPYNLHPNLITFHVVSVPKVAGLPPGAGTTSDVPFSLNPQLMTAMDSTRPQVEALLRSLNPNPVFFDFAHWIPDIASTLGFKTVNYIIVSAASVAIALVPDQSIHIGRPRTQAEPLKPPSGYPSSTVVPRPHEAGAFSFILQEFGSGLSFYERSTAGMKGCDVLAFRTYREIEGQFCDYISSRYGKPLLVTGPAMPESDKVLEEKWQKWLDGFEPRSVIFCAFGSQVILEKQQFQELLLAMELTGNPFMVALKPPQGAETVEEAIPEGFEERNKEKGKVIGEWVQQREILRHKSVGCFVSHCGFGSMWESLLSDPQIVLVPYLGDHILNTRSLVEELKVAVEVDRDKEGRFSKQGLCSAVKSVMDEESIVGKELRKNHAKWKQVLSEPSLLNGCVEKFIQDLSHI